MLSGLLPPTSGEAKVFGQSIRTQMPLIRETLGVCPQHNILWPILTVQEHLQLYGAVKGVPRAELQRAVDEMIEQVGLTEKRHVASAALSGGMQRKLSVAIALIGDSRIVFLDEPTSGMDPYSRRATWDLLKKRKEGRVIILTTHFMDEADALGDRIAIMAAGHLQCVGSSLFLKTRFGVGYSLVITKAGGQCDEDAIHEAIAARVESAELVNNIAGELSYKLPFAASPNFPDLFDTFDHNQQQWGIQSYGISVTTLEEVFLKVGKDAAAHAKIHGQSRANSKLIPGSVAAGSAAEAEDEKADSSGVQRVQVRPKEEKELTSPGPTYVNELTSPTTHSHSNLFAGMPLSSPSVMKPLNSPGAAAGSGPGSPIGGGGGMGNPSATTTVDALGHGVLYNRSHPARRHIRALLIKRFQNAKRNRKNWCWTIIIPFLVMIVFLGIIRGLNDVSIDVEGVTYGDLNSPEQVPYAMLGNSTAFMGTVAGGSGGGMVQPLDVTGVMADPSNTTQFADWLYTSESQLQLSRYGALVYQATTTSPQHNTTSPTSLPLVADNVALYTNTTYLYSLPLYYTTYNTALLRYLTGSPTAQITLQFWPFPQTANSQVLVNSITAIVIGIAFAFIPSNFIYYTVKEKTIKSKHQQFISGVTPFTYHAAHFIWDFINYLVPAILCLIVIAIYDIKELIGVNVGATIVALLLYGLSIVPFSALCSFLYESPTTAQNTMLIFYILTSCFLLIVSIVLGIISSTKNIASSLRFPLPTTTLLLPR